MAKQGKKHNDVELWRGPNGIHKEQRENSHDKNDCWDMHDRNRE
jgi:hypothetical protein